MIERVDSATVRAKANGVTKANFAVAGFPGQVVLVVGQSVASVAMPVESVSSVAPVRLPPPVMLPHVTVTPGTGWLSASRASTHTTPGTRELAGAL